MPGIPSLPERPWSKPTPIANAYSDDSPALATDGTTLYLVFKKAGVTDIYFSSFTDGTWTGPVYTGIQSEDGPALTWNPTEGKLYMFWQAVGEDALDLDYGTFDLSSGSCTRVGQVASASTGNSPASTWWQSGIWIVHTGRTSDDIYYCEPDGDNWDEDNIKGKSSNRAPAIAAIGNVLYMVHSGGGATDEKDLFWSPLPSSDDPHKDWPGDEELSNGATSGRPGLGAWTSEYLILAHNSSSFINLIHPEASLQWHYYDVANDAWHWEGYCGPKFQTTSGPALCYFSPPESTVAGPGGGGPGGGGPGGGGPGGGGLGGGGLGGGGEATTGMYMVWPNAADTSNQLVWSVLKSVT